MKRLNLENNNTPAEYDEIFIKRKIAGANWQDLRRWKKLLRFFKGGNLIDIGCLDSNIPPVAKALSPKSNVWGIDVAETAIHHMQQQYPYVDYRVMDLYKIEFPDNHFDYAVMGEVIEHLEDPKAAIKEAMRILKPGGRLALSTPLNEEAEPGAVDHIHHIWSYSLQDIFDLLKPYGGVDTSVLSSQHFPTYKYAWPSIIAWVKKK